MKKGFRNFLIIATILLAIAVFLAALNIANSNKINWGMEVAGVAIGSLTPQAAWEKLEINHRYLIEKDFYLIYENYKLKVNLKSLGVEINISKTVNLAFERGHQEGKFFLNQWWQIGSFFGYNLEPIWKISEDKLEKFLKENLSAIHQPARNSILVYDRKKQDFTIAPNRAGVVINKEKLRKDLSKIVSKFQTADIQLSLMDDRPEVVETETEKARQQALNLLKKAPIALTVIIDNKTKQIETMDKETVLNLMDFVAVPDETNPQNKALMRKKSRTILFCFLRR